MLALLVGLAGCAPKCFVKKDEQVDFYPTYFYRRPDGRWAMPVMAWAHETQPSSELAQGVAKIANVVALFPEAGAAATHLQQRLNPFLVRGRSGIKIPIKLEAQDLRLGASDADGYVREDLVLPSDPPATSTTAWVPFQTQECRKDSRVFRGEALAIPEQGISVIADLDALALRESPATSAMDSAWASAFGRWKARGAVFHYVSSSPWQWFGLLSQRLRSEGLPQGVLQLKSLPLNSFASSPETLLANVAALVAPSSAFKASAMEAILQRFPNRRFILVGDAKQGDIDLFSPLAAKYPRQIERIVTNPKEAL